MIQFRTASGKSLEGHFTYSDEDQSFEFLLNGTLEEVAPSSREGTTGLALDSLQLETAVEDGRILYAWGYHPRSSWRHSTIQLPPSEEGLCLAYSDADELVPGVSERVSRSSWITEFDSESGFLRLAHDAAPAQYAIKVATGIHVAIEDGQLVELWLQPELVD